jgi:Uroporphyrinogen decarboxylase (URO-D)
MTPRERVIAALQRKQVDNVPWIEIGVAKNIAESILGKNLVVSPFSVPEHDEDFEHCSQDSIDFVKCIGLSAMEIKMWAVPLHKTQGISENNVSATFNIHTDRMFLDEILQTNSHTQAEHNRRYIKYAEHLSHLLAKDNLAQMVLLSGPYSFAEASVGGLAEMSILMYDNPSLVHKLIEYYTHLTCSLAEKIKKRIDVDLFVTPDDLAHSTGLFFSPEMFRKFIKPSYKKIRKAFGETPWLFHSDGNVLQVVDDFIEIGIDAFCPVERKAMDIVKFKQTYGDHVCIMGNLDVDLIERETVTNIQAETLQLLQKLGKCGYIFSSGNTITTGARINNIRTISRTIAEQ